MSLKMIPGYNWPCNVYRHDCRHLPSQCTATPYRIGYIPQPRQQSHGPVPVPSEKYCKCPRPCPIAIRRIPLCSSCVENSHADQYAAPCCCDDCSRQPEAYEPRLMSPKPTTQNCYTYQEMLNQSNYQRNFDRAVLKNPYEAPRSHVSFTKVGSQPTASSSGAIPRTRTTDHLQQFPSQVYVGGLLQESRHEPDDEPITQAMLSMEFEEHDPGNDTIVKENSPEAINSTADIHISLHHVFNLNLSSDLGSEMIVGVSNMPDNLNINFATDKKPANVDYKIETLHRIIQESPKVTNLEKGVNEEEKGQFLSNLQNQMTNFEMTDRKPPEAIQSNLHAKHQNGNLVAELQPGQLKMSQDIQETPVNHIKVSPQSWTSASNSTEVIGVEVMTSIVREVSVSILQDASDSLLRRPTSNQRPQSRARTSPSLPFADNFYTPTSPKSHQNSSKGTPTTPPARPIRKSQNSDSKKPSAGSQTYPPLKPSKSNLKKSVPNHRTDKIVKADPKRKSKVPSKHSINRRNTKMQHKNGRKTVQNGPQRDHSVTLIHSSVEVPTVDGSISIENTTSIILPNDPFSTGSPVHHTNHHGARNGQKLHSMAGPNPHSHRARGPMREDKGTSVECSRQTQTDGMCRNSPKPCAKPSRSGPSHGHSESASKMTYILCPRCCPKTPPPEHMTPCWDQHDLNHDQCGPKSSSVPLSPCPNRPLNKDCSKNIPKTSTGGKCSSANSSDSRKHTPQIHNNVSKQCGDYNSIKFCVPSANGNYEEVEHWILERQFLNSLTSSPKNENKNERHQNSKKQKRGNKEQRSCDDRCSSEYFVFTPNEFWGLPEKNAANGGLRQDCNNKLSLFLNNFIHSDKPLENPVAATKGQNITGQAVKTGQNEVPFQSPIVEDYAKAVMSAVRRQLAQCHHDSRKL